MKITTNFKQKIPIYVLYLLRFYILGVFVFGFFRFILFLLNISVQTFDFPFVIRAFKKGLQFDSVVLAYLMAIPVLLFTILSFFEIKKWHFRAVHFYLMLLMVVAIFINVADIPYFNYNFSRLSAVIFNFKSDFGIIVSMIKQEPTYFVFVLLFLVFIVGFLWLSNKKILKPILESLEGNKPKAMKIKWTYLLISFALIFMGIRGRIDSPIKITHAFFCNDAFYNQLGINPVFSLFKSMNSQVKLMDSKKALANTQRYLSIPLLDTAKSKHPLLRTIKGEEEQQKNIILVIMESMSAKKMSRFGNALNLTPHLDSLYKIGIGFDNIYSAGRHTYNGIFSTLYSYPAVLRESPMENLGKVKRYQGLPNILKAKGYSTNFFSTHDKSFDNIGGFLPQNGFDSVFSQHNYDSTKVVNAFGVSDHVMFDYSLKVFDSLHRLNKPFFSALMTISDHGPYVIPDGIDFKPNAKELKSQIIEYADWAIDRYIKMARKKPWFHNTVFVFVADHGVVYGKSLYELPLSIHHVPFLIYSADTQLVKPMINKSMGGQIDVFPTLMGLLNMNYENTTFGVNLFKEKRPFMYFSSDDKLGCINEKYYYIYNSAGKESLFDYKNRDKNDVLAAHKTTADSMRNYVLSNTQAAKYLMERK